MIELLVVVIIIGVLVAIAIPTFLSQRDKANEKAMTSDLRNAAAAATACSTDNNGVYTNCGTVDLLRPHGFNPTDGVTVAPTVINTPTAGPDGRLAPQAPMWPAPLRSLRRVLMQVRL